MQYIFWKSYVICIFWQSCLWFWYRNVVYVFLRMKMVWRFESSHVDTISTVLVLTDGCIWTRLVRFASLISQKGIVLVMKMNREMSKYLSDVKIVSLYRRFLESENIIHENVLMGRYYYNYSLFKFSCIRN